MKPPAPGIVHNHFNTQSEAPQRQMPAWRDRLGYLVDVPISRAQIASGFAGTIDRYSVNDLVFLDCLTDSLTFGRPVARISTDSIRFFVFYVVMEGGIGTVEGLYKPQHAARSTRSIMAVDMNQPIRTQRPPCRTLAFFVPRTLVESELPDADSLHGRIIEDTTPLTRLIFDHLAALSQGISKMSVDEADSALRVGIQLMIAAFGKQAKLTGNARAAARAAMFGQARRHVQANLHQAALSPESLLNTLQLPRATLYRLFEHEGGLGAYIRNRRLREAADELVRFPHLAMKDIAYGLGFNSHSDFTRAFRRAYGMAPQDLRAQVLQL